MQLCLFRTVLYIHASKSLRFHFVGRFAHEMVPLPKSGNFVIFLFFSKSVFSKNECQMQLVLDVWAFSEDSSSFPSLYITGTSKTRQLKGLPPNTGNRASSKSCGGRVSPRPALPRDIGLRAIFFHSARTRIA